VGKNDVVRQGAAENYLLVEGNDDEHVFYSLLVHHRIPKHFTIKKTVGKDKLLETFRVELKIGAVKRLGIVIDADTDIKARWLSIRNILIASHYSDVPLNPDPNGTIIQQEGLPIVGVWIMPNNKIPGYLEDFVSFLVPSGNVLWPMTDEAIQKVKLVEAGVRFKDVHESKARIHTWLAWQEEPGKPMGQAITARYLDADVPHVQQLLNWIRKMFIS